MNEYYDLILVILGFSVFISIFITAQGWIEKKMKNKASNTSGALVSSEEKNIVTSEAKFLAFYGIKIPLDPNAILEHEDCWNGKDERCIRAKKAGLQTYSDRLTDGKDYFLYVGVSLGVLGLDHSDYTAVDWPESKFKEIDHELEEVSFSETPALHLQAIYEH
jgi:hypothetical protein